MHTYAWTVDSNLHYYTTICIFKLLFVVRISSGLIHSLSF